MSKQTDKSRNDQIPNDQDAPPNTDRLVYLSHPGSTGQTLALPVESIPPEMQLGVLRHDLQEAQDKYALLYDYVPNGYVTLDRQAIVFEINRTLCVWLGIERGQLIGVDFSRYVAPDFQSIMADHLKGSLSGNPKQRCEITLKKKNGSLMAVRIESTALRDSRGQFSRVLCIVNDVSLQQQQMQSERLHQLVLDLSDEAILATDRNLVITKWNKAAHRLFGWSEEEVLDNHSPARVRSQILEPLIGNETLQGLTENGVWSNNVTCRSKDGSQFTCHAAVGVIWDNTGSFNGLAVVCRRLTSDGLPVETRIAAGPLEELVIERTRELSHTIQVLQQEINMHKQAALAARESEGKNRDLVDNIKLGIFRCTPGLQGRFLEVNKAMEEISGLNREELLQIHVCDLYINDAGQEPYTNEINISDWKITRELKLKKKDGRVVTVAVTVVAIRFESGVTQYFDGILEDITERKQAQLQIQQSLQQLQKTIKEIIEAMAYIGEVRDPYTAGHQRRVAQLSLEIGKAMGLEQEKFEGLRMAAFVHDIGKILVPSDILSKPGKLSKPEFDMLRDHTRIGYEILKTIEFPWPIATIVLQHHERINGTGYPFGLSGEQIIIEARILAVADVVEAMSSHRPYRPALGVDKALDEITANRGTLYDPEVVDICLKLFSEKGYDLN